MAFATSPDSIAITRLDDGMYVEINDGFTQLTGFTKEDITGKTSVETNVWNDLRDRKKLVEGLRKHGHYENLEAQFRKKDGTLLIGLMSAKIIELNDEPHLITVTRDISMMRQAEKELREASRKIRESEEIFESIFNNVSGGTGLLDLKGNFLRVNKMMCEITG